MEKPIFSKHTRVTLFMERVKIAFTQNISQEINFFKRLHPLHLIFITKKKKNNI